MRREGNGIGERSGGTKDERTGRSPGEGEPRRKRDACHALAKITGRFTPRVHNSEAGGKLRGGGAGCGSEEGPGRIRASRMRIEKVRTTGSREALRL